ncbi:MAG TPA: adenylate/guanylate cyclase domain-containing protein [Acidimicrobiales bacterium]|nr:adenylate/guanylate cyclase domain-containing protein [Acidimicrobiales bacterium]
MRIERCFGFVDLCGFTAFTERHGDERTVVVLADFRTRLREIAARRGVRVAKWLGDGAMLSSADVEATVAMVVEVAARSDPDAVPLQVRAGLAHGAVIMFEGDDYIGRATNVASRLCDAASPGQVLCTREVASLAPRWVASGDPAPYRLAGFDRPLEACCLEVGTADDVVVDPHCGLRLPEVTGLATRFDDGGAVHRFCSTACAVAWEQGQRRRAAAY